MLLARMYYNNGGGSWTDNEFWLNNQSHCTWSGISCDLNSRVTEVNLPNNNLSGSMVDISGLSGITSIILDMNSLSGAIPNNVCAISSSIFLQVDDALCEDPGTAVGCCDKVRTGEVTIDQITASVLGTATCGDIANSADVSACQWMEEELNHPLKDDEAHTTAYLTVRFLPFFHYCNT